MAHKCTGYAKNLFLHPIPTVHLMGESLLGLSAFWWLERNLCLSIFWISAAGGHSYLDNPRSLCLDSAPCPPQAPHSTTLESNLARQMCWSSNRKKQTGALNVTWPPIPVLVQGGWKSRWPQNHFLKLPRGPKSFQKPSPECLPKSLQA